MHSPEQNPEFGKNESIVRYYENILEAKKSNFENIADIHTIIEKLFVGEGLLDEDADTNNLFNYINRIQSSSKNTRVRFEQYTLLPLTFARYIEQTRSLKDTLSWYRKTVDYILDLNSEKHSEQCIKNAISDVSDACIHSLECPYVVVAGLLTTDVYEPDFRADFRYSSVVSNKKGVEIRPAFKIAMRKMHIVENSYELSYAYDECRVEEYLADYYELFPELGSTYRSESPS